MRGTIKAYSLCVNAGVIEGDDGKAYGFFQTEWNGRVAPVVNESVTFNGNSQRASLVVSEK